MIQIDWLTPGVPTPIRLYYRLLNAEPSLKPTLRAQFSLMMMRCRPIQLDDFEALRLNVFHQN